MALLEEGVYHEPDLLPPDVDGWQEWAGEQLERIFLGGAAFSFEHVERWLEQVQTVTGIDASVPLAIARRAQKEVAVP